MYARASVPLGDRLAAIRTPELFRLIVGLLLSSRTCAAESPAGMVASVQQ
jgi:hypothetical protein